MLVDPAIGVMAAVLKPTRRRTVRPELQVAVAKDILDRNGLKSPEKMEVAQFTVDPRELTDEQLQAIIRLREELAKGKRRQP